MKGVMRKPLRIFVTGGAGFIGSNFIRDILGLGTTIRSSTMTS